MAWGLVLQVAGVSEAFLDERSSRRWSAVNAEGRSVMCKDADLCGEFGNPVPLRFLDIDEATRRKRNSQHKALKLKIAFSSRTGKVNPVGRK